MKSHKLDDLDIDISAQVKNEYENILSIRRHIHSYPELKNDEFKTQSFILNFLAQHNIDAESIGSTGVLATIPGTAQGPTVLYRADMDALPIQEQNSVAYASKNDNIMHACGHDAHVAIALITAKLLRERRLERGLVKILFQPAEEGGGGAQQMIDAGVLENPVPDFAFAFHVWTPHKITEVAISRGPVAASVDGFELKVHGTGTHGAVPESGIDPIPIGAQIISAAQTLISRRKSPHHPAVLSFCSIQGGNAFNVIPDEVTLLGTIRTFDDTIREEIKRELESLSSSIASAMGGHSNIRYFESICPTVNDPTVSSIAMQAANSIRGVKTSPLPEPLMVGEDMGLILNKIPGSMILLGCGNPALQATFPHHHANFAIDERVMPIGVELALRITEKLLKIPQTP